MGGRNNWITVFYSNVLFILCSRARAFLYNGVSNHYGLWRRPYYTFSAPQLNFKAPHSRAQICAFRIGIFLKPLRENRQKGETGTGNHGQCILDGKKFGIHSTRSTPRGIVESTKYRKALRIFAHITIARELSHYFCIVFCAHLYRIPLDSIACYLCTLYIRSIVWPSASTFGWVARNFSGRRKTRRAWNWKYEQESWDHSEKR